MSVTFTPTVGAVTTYHYFDAWSGDQDFANDDVQNEIIRFAHDTPSVNMANGNARRMLGLLNVTRYDNEQLVGHISAADCRDLIADLYTLMHTTEGEEQAFVDCYSSQWLELLRHAMYHNCDITFA